MSMSQVAEGSTLMDPIRHVKKSTNHFQRTNERRHRSVTMNNAVVFSNTTQNNFSNLQPACATARESSVSSAGWAIAASNNNVFDSSLEVKGSN